MKVIVVLRNWRPDYKQSSAYEEIKANNLKTTYTHKNTLLKPLLQGVSLEAKSIIICYAQTKKIIAPHKSKQNLNGPHCVDAAGL